MTDAELAILSLVAEGPRHGYEIEQTIEARGMRDWTEIGFSSIYYLLKKLEEASLIDSQMQHPKGRGPARKVYTLTPEGYQAYVKAALEALEKPHQRSSPFLLGLSNYPRLSREQVLKALRMYLEGLEGRLAHVLIRREDQKPLPAFVDSMFDYSSTMIQAEMDWIRNFMKEVEADNVEG